VTLQDKRGIVFGVADDHSNAWAIAKAANDAGARVCLTYVERFEKNVRKLAEELNDPVLLTCDVTDESRIQSVYDTLAKEFGTLDFVVHSVAFARREDLEGSFIKTNWEGFALAMQISAYSLLAVTRPALPLMPKGGSVLTLSYLGAERAMPSYNMMGVAKAALEACVRYMAADLGSQGIRVNALSLGPIRTLAAMGVKGFRDMLKNAADKNALKRNIEQREVGSSALLLLSDAGSGITGQTIYVDCGYSIMGL
jgi:enoyl-[acyl-carrier protein] reductase I